MPNSRIPSDRDHDHVYRYDASEGWCNTFDCPTHECCPLPASVLVVTPGRRTQR